MRIDKDADGKKKRPVVVQDVEEILDVLHELEGTGELNESYYYMTTKEPNPHALDSLVDRVFGRPHQSSDIAVKGSVSVQFAEQFKKDAGTTSETSGDNS